MKLWIDTYTNIGTRSVNEDYVTFCEQNENLLAVVADGLGGHDKGEVASEYVGSYLREHYHFEKGVVQELGDVLRGAQNALLEKQKQEMAVNAMKTTVVVLSIRGDKAYFAHVGDSRGYAFEKRRNYVRTLDHSVPQMLVLAGDIKEEQIRHHSERSSLLRVMGSPWEKDAFEIGDEINVKKVKAFLLCTDGFWELIEEKEMMRCLKEAKTPGEWLKKMAAVIKQNAGGQEMDNYTAAAVFVAKR